MNNDIFRRFCEFQIKNILLSHKFLSNNAKSMFLIKSAIQYNNSTTDSVVALYGVHLFVITPRQHSYLRRCWSGGKAFATLFKIWSACDSNSRPQAITVNTVVQWFARSHNAQCTKTRTVLLQELSMLV